MSVMQTDTDRELEGGDAGDGGDELESRPEWKHISS
jgi:hypothetical protein